MNTRLTDVQKQALRDDAIRAGGGKWRYVRLSVHSQGYITDEKGSTVINCTAGDVPANCVSFLESAHPAAVLLLLDELAAKDAEPWTIKERTDLRELIICEISDFFAGFGSPGEPETPEEMQRQLINRVGRILNEHAVNYPRCEALVEILKECRIARDAAQAELQEYRKAVSLELKPANLINKFYERYPLANFKSDSERAEALGYFMAGAELQCYGDFIAYEGGNSDE